MNEWAENREGMGDDTPAAGASPAMDATAVSGNVREAATEEHDAGAGGRKNRKDHGRHPEGTAAKVYSEEDETSAEIQRAKFPSLGPEAEVSPLQTIDYLKDVDLEASVELGSTSLTVDKILKLGSGSVIELNQTLGDPVRLLINGSYYAQGEVVVIGEKFGIRITQIMQAA